MRRVERQVESGGGGKDRNSNSGWGGYVETAKDYRFWNMMKERMKLNKEGIVDQWETGKWG